MTSERAGRVRIGAIFRPQLPPERLKAAVIAAEDAGLDELWLWEDCFLESGIAPAVAALAWTQRITLGIGLLPVPLRNVAITAMELATVDRLFPSRFSFALGHGIQDWMGQVGARVESPLTLMREHVGALRPLLAGDEVSVEGRYVTLNKVALGWPPHTPPRILMGATGPNTLRLSGEIADGVVLDEAQSPQGVRAALELVAEGRAVGVRSGTFEVVKYVPALARDAQAVADVLAEYVDAGATTVVLQPPAGEQDIEGYFAFTGVVAARLRAATG